MSEVSMSLRNPQGFAEARQKNSSGKTIKENQLQDSESCCSEPDIQRVNVCCSPSKYDHKRNSKSSHIPAAGNKQRYEIILLFSHPKKWTQHNIYIYSHVQREHHNQKIKFEKDLNFLQTFKPQRSVNNRDDAAERTDILYDPVSY